MKKKFALTKKKLAVIIGALLALVFLLSPLAPYCLSLGVMSVYSRSEAAESLMAEKGVQIEIPSAKGWYPFAMTFNAGRGFAAFSGESDVNLSVIYNFPQFDLRRGCSRLYDPQSDYYTSFYGAYCVEGDFGFAEDGSLDEDEAALVPEYDLTRLVLRDLGMSPAQEIFEWQSARLPADEAKTYSLAGFDGWQRVDAVVRTNGAAHEDEGFLRNYVQYGRPGYEAEEDFAPVTLRGRVYGRYFAEKDCGVFFYVLAADEDVIEDWENAVMAESSVSLS